MLTFEMIRNNEEIRAYIEKGNANLGVMGFTEHYLAHAMKVSQTAAGILSELGYGGREIELARIAGYMHDLGNCINRNDHAHTGALMAMQILRGLGMDPGEIAVVIAAIGNHDEKTGTAVDPVSAALILADKADVRRSRVRNTDTANFDIHDRVNFSVGRSELRINEDRTTIKLDLTIDTAYCTVMDFFEIFLERMILCRKAAERLGLRFKLIVNGQALQ